MDYQLKTDILQGIQDQLRQVDQDLACLGEIGGAPDDLIVDLREKINANGSFANDEGISQVVQSLLVK